MTSHFRKNILREIRTSLGRFLAITIIVALGVGFLAGLLTTAPVMRCSVDVYYDESNLYDLSVMTTMGLDESDLEALSAVEGVEAVMPFYQKDVTAHLSSGDTLAVRIMSRPFDEEATDDRRIQNRLQLLEGRFPTQKDECVVTEKQIVESPVKIGDVIRVSEENGDVSDALCCTAFHVVGLVSDSCYFSIERESTSVGSGTLHDIIYTTEDAFSYEVYTNAYAVIKNADSLNSFEAAYTELADTVADRIEKTGSQRSSARYEKIYNDAKTALESAKQSFSSEKAAAEALLADAQMQLDDGKEAFEKGSRDLEAGKKEYEDGIAEYASGKAALASALETADQQISDAQASIDEGEAALSQAKEKLSNLHFLVETLESIIQHLENRDDKALQQLLDNLINTYGSLGELEKPLRDAIAYIEQNNTEKINALIAELTEKYNTLLASYQDAAAQYASGEQELNAAKQQLLDARIRRATEEATANLKLEQAKTQLDAAKATIDESEKQLAASKAELENTEKELEAQKQTAEKEFAEAKAKIDDAEKQLEDLSKPTWYVFTRSSNVSYKSFADNADKMEAIARVFPVFFFLVAALVALTTMTRMVEEQRVQIGTFKALGFADTTIMAKYLLYAGLATLIGCVIGLSFGLTVLPSIIWTVYKIMYDSPAIQLLCPIGTCLIAAGAAFASTMLSTYFACRSTLKEAPASLMLPKAPKAGKRILLERIRPLWPHLRFSHKVTARNLFRYKKRLFMTIFGIAGCTALLVTGFGIKDSIGSICDRQFTELQSYNLTVFCDDISDELTAILETDSQIERYLPAFQQSVTAGNAADTSRSRTTLSVYLFVPSETDLLPSFITLRTRNGHRDVAFSKDSVVITEKMAETLSLSVGDHVTLSDEDNHCYELPIGGIIENYVYSYVYVPRELYESVFQNTFRPNSVLTDVNGAEDAAVREKVGAEILESESALAVQFTEDISSTFQNIIKSIDAVVYVLIVSAAALAFVVLYNLTNINLTERQRELATLKVLGFNGRETAMYIFREITLLSLLGTAIGLGFGIALHAFVIRTVEIDMVMFGREIFPASYLFAAVLTMLFSTLVDLTMLPKLMRIDMVESLKSVE